MTTTQTPPPTEVTNDPAAHDTLRAAQANAYRFPVGFGGFTATISHESTGETADGTVTVNGPRAIEVDLMASETALGWVQREISSMAGHRWPSDYDQGDGRWPLTLEDDGNPLGARIVLQGDQFSSSYRVRDGRISQVNRRMGPMRFTIHIQSHQPLSDGRTLPGTFTVSFWDLASGRLTRSDVYTDHYVEVDRTWLPASRRVVTTSDDGIVARAFSLSDYRLLTGSVAPVAPEAARRAHD